jgi:hypothetical protein
VSAPLPGTREDHERRARIRRAVTRGRVYDDPDDARIAVEEARDQLRGLARAPRLAIIAGIGSLVWAGAWYALDPNWMAGVIALIGVAQIGLGVPLIRHTGRRLEDSLRGNEAAAGLGAPARDADQHDHRDQADEHDQQRG